MNNEELNKKFMAFEQQIRQIQEQLHAVDNAIFEMNAIDSGLSELEGNTGKEIMAPIGRGIFVKAKLLSEELTVDVGNNHFVKKDISKTKELIQNQIKKLGEMKNELENSLESINKEITQSMLEAQNANSQE